MAAQRGHQRPTAAKKAAFVAVAIAGAALLTEFVARAALYQRHSGRSFALAEITGDLNPAERTRGRERAPLPPLEHRMRAARGLYESDGTALLAEFQHRYRDEFASLVDTARAQDAVVVACYIPAPPSEGWGTAANRAFFADLAAAHDVKLVDMTSALHGLPEEWSYLMPEDQHLSRLGHQLVGQHLAEALQEYRGHHSSWVQPNPPGPEDVPVRFGDLPREHDKIDGRGWATYHVDTNRQGLRMQGDVLLPKRGLQYVLLLGDSFTFGVHMGREHTFAHYTQRQLERTLVINAGVCGYSIEDQAALFAERARFMEPDVVVLQMFDNDLTDMFSHMRGYQARERPGRAASGVERRFLEWIGMEAAPR